MPPPLPVNATPTSPATCHTHASYHSLKFSLQPHLSFSRSSQPLQFRNVTIYTNAIRYSILSYVLAGILED
ncbi:hypothetical protein E2C01_005350 [Portunus trituberculatus]|uniref:Uncharacterized protein n=1 Tax=Portunus trituberculatus TaxID=210409 RepID=A0A5B7CWF9_PORTR|nr:hypothetical protein [Portunus trituberculatus]